MADQEFHGISANSAVDALSLAATSGKTSEMKLLLADGTAINGIASYSRSTPLADAAGHGLLKSVKFLLENRADINRIDANEMTPLMRACSCGRKRGTSVAQTLIQAGAEVTYVRESDGMTALKFAACGNSPQLIQSLIDNRAEVDGPAGTDLTAMMLAA